MRKKPFAAILLSTYVLIALTACGKPGEAADTLLETAAVQTGETVEEDWLPALGEELFQKYGVLPERYEDLGNGLYQVYAEVGGEVIPIVIVDSATLTYEWNTETED